MVSSASAIPYYFYKITNNGNPDVSNQLYVDVLAADGGLVEFEFHNAGPVASSITDIYFDDGTLLGISYIVNGVGVSFDNPASPGNLPGGNLASPAFVTTADFSADSDSPVMANGVNPGEYVEIYFNLQGTQTWADTIASLNNGSLRIGLHVQAIGLPGGSDSYVNTPNDGSTVPEPGTMILLGLGLLGLGITSRKRS
jgi:hypothetical protein